MLTRFSYSQISQEIHRFYHLRVIPDQDLSFTQHRAGVARTGSWIVTTRTSVKPSSAEKNLPQRSRQSLLDPHLSDVDNNVAVAGTGILMSHPVEEKPVL